MAQRKRHGIRRVIRFRRRRQRADALHHIHDLALLRSAVADDRLLDLKRSVFIYPDSGFPACQQDDAPAVRD